MKCAILFIALMSLSAMGKDFVPIFKPVNLKAGDGYYFEHAERDKFLISKIRFTIHANAIKFCANHSMPMVSDADGLMLGMSASHQIPEIANAFLIPTSDPSQAAGFQDMVFWNKTAGEIEVQGIKKHLDVKYLQRERGLFPSDKSFEEMKPLLSKANIWGLPAICGQFEKPTTGPSDYERNLAEEIESTPEGAAFRRPSRHHSK